MRKILRHQWRLALTKQHAWRRRNGLSRQSFRAWRESHA